jgi:hypothetical protein
MKGMDASPEAGFRPAGPAPVVIGQTSGQYRSVERMGLGRNDDAPVTGFSLLREDDDSQRFHDIAVRRKARRAA